MYKYTEEKRQQMSLLPAEPWLQLADVLWEQNAMPASQS